MYLKLDRISIVKKGLTGEAKVEYNLFSINKIVINVASAVEPVAIPKYDGTHILSGQLLNEIKEQIFDLFQTILNDAPDGIYEVVPELEYSVNKL